MQSKNRDYPIIDGQNDTTVFATCPHCKEPFTIEGKIREHLYEKDETVSKCYCRGANGLSFRIRCCVELNCAKKKGNWCDLVAMLDKGKTFPPSKEWNVIVSEPEEVIDNDS
jgi:hypothetical protein